MCQKICGGYKRHTDESEDFMRITIFSLGGLLGQYVTNGASSRRTGDRLRAGCKSDLAEKKYDRD